MARKPKESAGGFAILNSLHGSKKDPTVERRIKETEEPKPVSNEKWFDSLWDNPTFSEV